MAESEGHFGGAFLVVEGLSSSLVSRTYCYGIDAVDIAVGCTRVVVATAIPRSKHIDATLGVPALR